MKKILFLLFLFISINAHASYYCSFTCISLNPMWPIVKGIEGIGGRSVMIDQDALVTGQGSTDYQAYKNTWEDCFSKLGRGTRYLIVTNTLILRGGLIYGGRDASPSDCKQARD